MSVAAEESKNRAEKESACVIPSWVVEEQSGEGGYGQVMKVHSIVPEVWAIKITDTPLEELIECGLASSEIREVTFQRLLQHRNIMPIVEAFRTASDTGSALCARMPFGELGSLSAFLKTNPSPTARYEIADDIAEALLYVHAHQIGHFDVKPGNIMIQRSDIPARSVWARLTDFGLSQFVGGGRSTAPDHLVTLAWRAPELVGSGGRAYTSAVDLWSYGLVLLELFFDLPPFVGVNVKTDPQLAQAMHELLGFPKEFIRFLGDGEKEDAMPVELREHFLRLAAEARIKPLPLEDVLLTRPQRRQFQTKYGTNYERIWQRINHCLLVNPSARSLDVDNNRLVPQVITSPQHMYIAKAVPALSSVNFFKKLAPFTRHKNPRKKKLALVMTAHLWEVLGKPPEKEWQYAVMDMACKLSSLDRPSPFRVWESAAGAQVAMIEMMIENKMDFNLLKALDLPFVQRPDFSLTAAHLPEKPRPNDVVELSDPLVNTVVVPDTPVMSPSKPLRPVYGRRRQQHRD